jgi:hypothetical protein
MKNLTALVFLMFLFCGTSFGQSVLKNQESDVVLRITLSKTDASYSKKLKNLSLSKVFKGESRTVFLVKTNSDIIEKAKTEIESRFDSVRIEEINVVGSSK